ncbi:MULTISPECIES: tetratricopeptide repeat protein [unclassified Ruegeria]|uniref:tetratricopeptide repeat protein n=1 Tax=unclassified Ruegeria TaxID=2625375 RepID=UPI0014884021|nr:MULTISPECIES: tetratricopeptide repeat protein [unclassified Ruegeria]NOD65580.1 tetratricopeptide repeat protein [Ruegeria sp. HKCCD6109]
MSWIVPPIGARLTAALFAAVLLLSACDSAEERAEAHFQAGLAHLEAGDVERALVEFRNVFKLNGQHKDARLTFARLERERGNISLAYGQYLRLVEQYPDNLEGQRSLAEMALETGNWDDVRRHGAAAAALAPEDVAIQSINNTLAYTDAVRNGDSAGTDLTVLKAREILSTHPDLLTARQTVIDHLIRDQDWSGVLEETAAALALSPKQANLYSTRLRALYELEQPAEIENLLQKMTQVFPDDQGIEQALVQHYIAQGNLDAAQQMLRSEIVPQAEDHMPVQRYIAFLDQHRGTEAAIEEMDQVIAQGGPNTPRFKTMRAMLKFRSGDRAAAIADMQDLLVGAERTEQTRENEVEFARILFQADRPEDARALIETVISEDATQVDALKFKASWLIDEDNTGDAIVLLREALGQAPRDPQLMTLLAQAHERNGDRELMGEMLALAAEVSQNAPAETLRYVQFLIAEDDLVIGERVLIASLRRAPEHPELLFRLGEIYLRQQDWGRLEVVQRSISELDTPEARRLANELRAQMLAAQQQTDDLVTFLNELADDPEFGLPADIALIRLMLVQGKTVDAFARLDLLLEDNPDSLPIRLIKARALINEGEYDKAEKLYRTLLSARPDVARAWIALHSLETRRGNLETAQNVMAEALTTLPDNPDLLMLQAALYEQAGDLDQAIATYETLYPLSNQSLIVANNLASLLTTHRADQESLQRAHALARRLRGTRVPFFQDTYGWIAYRLGNYEEALAYLEPAAEALPDQPLVFYHLGRTYADLDRPLDALRAFKTAQALDASLNVSPPLEVEIERLGTANIAGQ